MFFKMPTEVYEEDNCVINHAKELAAFGGKALIVTGRHSAKANGSLADIQEALRKEGRTWAVFDEVEENPSVETVMKARDFGLKEKADFVIGIGGGSPLDAAKAVALMMAHPDCGWEFMYEPDTVSACTPGGYGIGIRPDLVRYKHAFIEEKTAPERALPIVAVPTTCGTGSEVTAVSVLTRHDLKTKGSIAHKLFPKLALVDAGYIEKAPINVIRSTAVDALAHLIESEVNAAATDYSRMFVRYGLSTWALTKEVLLEKRKPGREDLRNLMNASTYAGMAIAHAGTGLPHALSYALTYELGMAHGKACGFFLPGYLRETPGHERREILELTEFASVSELKGFLSEVCQFEKVPEELLERDVKKVAANPAKLATSPYPVDEDVLRRICGI